MQQTLEEEEGSDTAMRTQYGQKWNRMPSSSLNSQFKQSLTDYQSKLQMAANTDQQITQKFQSNQESLRLLSKPKSELGSMIPQSADTQALEQNPTVVAYVFQLIPAD